MMRYKKATHIGIIISYAIFIGFLISLILAVRPIITTKESNSPFLTNILKEELIKKASVEVVSITIANISGHPAPIDCISINKTSIGRYEQNQIVKDKDNQLVNSSLVGSILNIKYTTPQPVFFKVYFSNESFKTTSMNNIMCNSATKKGLVKTHKYISEKKIVQMINEYNANYNLFKNNLNIPNGTEFSFSFIYNNKTIINTRERNYSGEIYTKNFEVYYINNLADINSGVINIKLLS